MNNQVYIFDTTLRDGEQSPGVSLNIQEKLEIARQLSKLGVNIIEAGFPIASMGDFESVKTIAQNIKGATIAGLARASEKDIDRAWEAVKYAEAARIHTFIATSDIHLQHKLKLSREEVLEAAVAAVKHAKKYTADVEFSAEDAFRSDFDYLCQVIKAVIEAGAMVVNLPDTVGYATPSEYGDFIKAVTQRVPNIDKAIISVHCHNDLGLAVANSLAAVANGARQVECTINGIGERAGNTAMEEVVMALYTRKSIFNLSNSIVTEEIYRTSKLVSSLTGMPVQHNKAIVGKNAFAHESGIHQDGVLKERTTYEIMNPTMLGIFQNNIVLGKLSGRHAFRERLGELGFSLADADIEKAFFRFKDLADKKKEITNQDIIAIVEDEVQVIPKTFSLEYLHISSGTTIVPTATVGLKKEEDEVVDEAACGDGPIDAIFKAIDKVAGEHGTLVDYALKAITGGKDALGEVTVKIKANNNKVFTGRGLSTDVLEASAKAYVSAVNKIIYDEQSGAAVTGEPQPK